jgi:uncharacterized Ntn-hydrolase superfamily protein
VRRRALWLVALALLLPCGASATWSIVAVDPETREVGVAGASCIGNAQVIAGLAPGRGAIAAQAMGNLAGRDRGVELLAGGASPQAVIAAIASDRFDSLAGVDTSRLRQYGVAALGFEDAPAAYTGSWTFDWRGHDLAPSVSVQGNLLVGPAVVSRALAAFTAPSPPGAHRLADRLLRGLEAGADAGGDARCMPKQAALSAFLMVAAPGDAPGSPSLRLVFPGPGDEPPRVLKMLGGELMQRWRRYRGELAELAPGEPERNPVKVLRRLYDAQRSGAQESGSMISRASK